MISSRRIFVAALLTVVIATLLPSVTAAIPNSPGGAGSTTTAPPDTTAPATTIAAPTTAAPPDTTAPATTSATTTTTATTAPPVTTAPATTGATSTTAAQLAATATATSLDTGPTGIVNSADATFTFSADEPGATFTCSLDGAPAAPCTTPATFPGLADGTHSFTVTASPAATPASASWTIDTIAPTVNATPPSGTYSSAQIVNLTASEPADIRVTTDGSEPTPASPLYAGPIDVAETTTLKFFAVDGAGNSSPVQTATIEITPNTVTFAPVADARVESASANTNFGSANLLRVDTSPAEEAFLRFDVNGIAGTVTSARLRVFVTNGTGNGPTVYLTENGWTEAALTWNNRPPQVGAPSDDLGAVAIDTWAEFDVTPLVNGDGTVSFNIGRTSSDAIHFHSREGADPSLRPQLVVTFSGGPPPPPDLPTVSATPGGGTYATAQSVTLAASEPATIRYTTDGTDPSSTSAIYDSPIAVTAAVTLKFFAVAPDGRTSGIATETYAIDVVDTVSFAPAADARVEGAQPAANFGTATSLIVDSSPQTESYLRFDVDALTGPVQNAVLRLYVFNNTVNGPAVYSASNGWDESGITWNNRPPRSGTGVDDKGALPVDAWAEFNVTSLISGNGTFTLVLATTSSDGTSFYSRESGNTTLRPQLVVTAVHGTAPPNTTIDSGPSDPTNLASATFTFSSDEPGSSFACALDGSEFTACSSPHTYDGLAAGLREFQVRAIDLDGNVDPTPADATWTIDQTPPSVTSVAPADGAIDVAVTETVSAVFSEDVDPATLSGVTVRLVPQGSGTPVPATVTYDGPSRTVTLVPDTILTGGTMYRATVAGGVGGAADRAGNPLAIDETWSFTVTGAPTPVTFTVNPVADAWVDSATPGTNYGSASSLSADTSPASQSFLRFSVSGITAPVNNARLRVFAFSSTNNGPAVHAAGPGWTETGVTWNNRPAATGYALDDVPGIASGTWVEYDVTAAITGDGTFVLALIPASSDAVSFYSRENAVNPPELVVTFGGTMPPIVSANPAGGSYPDPVDVTLTASEPATIHYTTDGSVPTSASAVYTGPLSISVPTTLTFFALTPDGRPSAIGTDVYSIGVTGVRDFSFGSARAPTAKEGESKVWYTGGVWFGALFQPAAGDFHIFRLDPTTQTWSDTGTLIDTRNTAHIDALWDGSRLYTVSAVLGTEGSARAELRRFSYSGGVYTLDDGFPVILNSVGAEVIVMAKASDGRLWVTYTTGNRVYVTHSLGSDTSWTTPFVIPGAQSAVSSDDISSVVAFGNSVGVMWSNQNANTMYFGVHANGAADSAWTVEVAYGVPGQESADDHISLKADSSGRVYAAVKTSLNARGEPLIMLLVRQAGGGWSRHVVATAELNVTRPVVVLDEQAGRVHVFASAPCCAGGVIYHKSSSMSNISFSAGLGTPVIASAADPTINNVASTKQSVNAATGLLVIAGDDSTNFYFHNVLPI